jgi:hydroxymethylbilane synthase
VHSLKDLPTAIPDGLRIAAVPVRAEPWDAWVSARFPDLVDLPPGARVATGSMRRRAQILHEHPHLEVVGIRGNIDTRLATAEERGDAGIVLAAAGLRRSGRAERIRGTFTASEMTPAPGQGALAIEVREDDVAAAAAERLDDPAARAEVTAERVFLAVLEGGCTMPIGALGRVSGRGLTLVGMLATPDGERLLRLGTEGDADEPAALGESLARTMRRSGGQEILDLLAASRGGGMP